MIIITSEYNYYIVNLNETCNIIENTLLKHEGNVRLDVVGR